MLGKSGIITFLGSRNLKRSRDFYENTLGLNYEGSDEYAIMFQLAGALLRINNIPDFKPQEFTAIGWIVNDIASLVTQLVAKGIKMELYESFRQDELGIAELPDGTKLGYFKDPDGNVISLTQFP